MDRIPASILSERYIICAGWKWEGESKVHTVSVLDDPKRFEANPHDDYYVVSKLQDVLGEAGVLVHHNGDSFDQRYVATRALIHGMPPTPPVTTIDTCKVAKCKFLFNSNKLDYIAKVLGVGRKKVTSPGLWMRVLQGDPKAVKEMVGAYNKQDVLLLEKVFKKLQPYIPNHVNRELFGGAVPTLR